MIDQDHEQGQAAMQTRCDPSLRKKKKVNILEKKSKYSGM